MIGKPLHLFTTCFVIPSSFSSPKILIATSSDNSGIGIQKSTGDFICEVIITLPSFLNPSCNSENILTSTSRSKLSITKIVFDLLNNPTTLIGIPPLVR